MGLLLNKLLPLPFLPLGLALILGLAAVLFKKRFLGVLACAIVWGGSMPLTGDALLGQLERSYPRVAVEACPEADAIVVLGGYVRQGNGSSPDHPEFSEASERFFRGLDLLRAERAPRLVFTGAKIPWMGPDALPEGEFSHAAALRLGVDPQRLLLTNRVQNTADEASTIAALAKQYGWKRIILVTSAFHMPRAMEQFERAGVSAQAFPCDWRVDEMRPFTVLDVLPSGESLRDTELAQREWIGRLFYAIRAVLS